MLQAMAMRLARLSVLLVLSGCNANIGAGPSAGGPGGPGGGPGDDGSCAADGTDGCLSCAPGSTGCDGDSVIACGDDGRWTRQVVESCDTGAGLHCQYGRCADACAEAAVSQSYIGCEYWPTVTRNSQLGVFGGSFDFAVAVANPQQVPVDVSIRRGTEVVAQQRIPAGEVATIALPWVDELRGRNEDLETLTASSALVRNAAYRLVASMPVTAYQFNPLQYLSTTPGADNNSYTNDASMLLPTSALGGRNMVIARPSFGGRGWGAPGFLAVVGTADGTTVTLTSSARTQAGTGIAAMSPGESRTFTLDAGDVLQVLSTITPSWTGCDADNQCIGDRTTDLTGTMVEADAPVALFGGHDCTNVPYNRYACDHLEEQIFPLETWGDDVIVAATTPLHDGEPNVWKVVSAVAGNAITFEPAVHAPVTLAAGESVEFESPGAFRVLGTGRLAVAQFTVGQDFAGNSSFDDFNGDSGDPSMGLGVPADQFRASYDFLTPATYTTSYVNVIAITQARLHLDAGATAVPPLEPIGTTGYGFARIEVRPGAHHMSSEDGSEFGITVSGVAPYTSYLYAGGLDLERLFLE